jgi:hypothetical protein
MMKKFSILFAVIIIVTLLVVGHAAAMPAFKEVHTTEYLCIVDYSGADLWESGNVHHGRNSAEHYSVTSDDEPRIVGPMEISVNWNIHLRRGEGPSWGTFYRDVPAKGGAWTGTWNGKLHLTFGPDGSPFWLLDGHAVGHGLGDFEGKELRLELHQEIYDPADGHLCDFYGLEEPMLPVRLQNTGYIIENAGD